MAHKKVFSQEEICDKFKAFIRSKFEWQADAAKHYKVTDAYISSVKRGDCAPNAKMLEDMGFARKNGFIKV